MLSDKLDKKELHFRRKFMKPNVAEQNFRVKLLSVKVWDSLLVDYTSYPGRDETNTIKFGDSTLNVKLNRLLPNLIINFDLYVEPLSRQC